MTAFDSNTHRRRLPRHLLTVSLLGAALLSAWATHLAAEPSAERHLHAVLPTHRLADELRADLKTQIAKEYSAIRPADLDGRAPAIPPSETWPAQ